MMRYKVTVVCPNEDCEADIPLDSATPGDPGRVTGPPEFCYPPEPGEIEGPDKCPKCGVALDEKFWDDNYEQVMMDLAEAEMEDRASYLADEADRKYDDI